MIAASYDWPKASGIPVVDYELRLPSGLPLPDRNVVNTTVWSQRAGHGAYVGGVRLSADRPEIFGSFVLSPASGTMSLRLPESAEGHWRLPFSADVRLQKAFGPWTPIEFLPPARENARSLPPGTYEIRYRVRRYM